MGVRRAAAGLVVVLVLAGCAVRVPGTAAAVGGTPPGGPGEELARFRTWDVCAIHDVAAAERIVGRPRVALEPDGGFDDCTLTLGELGTSRLSRVTVALEKPEPGTGPATAVGGRSFPAVRAFGDACGYASPEPGGFALTVTVDNADDNTRACPMAQDYMGALLPRLDDPPLRAAGSTSPVFGLATADPCAAAASVSTELLASAGAGTDTYEPDGPRTCRLDHTPATYTPGAGYVGGTVTFGLEQFSLGVSGRPGVTGAGRPAAVDDEGTRCTVTGQASAAEVVVASLPDPHRETVTVTARDCATATRAVDTIVAAQPPAPAAAAGALKLGDLAPPPGGGAAPQSVGVGAPFDPCVTVTWADFPATVRAVPDAPAKRAVQRPGQLFRAGCTYSSPALLAAVIWGPPDGEFTVDPAVRTTGVVTSFAGRRGLEDRIPPRAGTGPQCISTMVLAQGLAGVISLAAKTSADMCAVNRAVLEALASRVP